MLPPTTNLVDECQVKAVQKALPSFCHSVDADTVVKKDKKQERVTVTFSCPCSPTRRVIVYWRWKTAAPELWPELIAAAVQEKHGECHASPAPPEEASGGFSPLSRVEQLERLVPELRRHLKRARDEKGIYEVPECTCIHLHAHVLLLLLQAKLRR